MGTGMGIAMGMAIHHTVNTAEGEQATRE